MTLQAKLLFDVIGRRALSRFEARCEHPMPEQEKLLRRLLSENADTEYGRRFDFASIDSFSGFQKQIPLSEYEDIEPYVEASRHGQRNQLTREPPVFYATTSGTTGARKFIPVTESSRRAKSHLMRTWLASLFEDHPAILDGTVLQVASPEVEDTAPDGTPIGAEAGHAYRNMPKLMRGMYPVPYEVCEIPDYEARYYAWLRLSVMHPVRVIGTPNPSTILLMSRYLGEQTERLIRDVRDGTLDPAMEVAPEIRELLEAGLEPDPERAAFLERAAAAGGGELLPREVWPDIEVLACWKGGTVGPYLEQLERFFPDDLPIRDVGWLSSECRGSVPLSDDGNSGALAVATNIYEFLPEDAGEDPAPTELLTVDQLEEGGRYSVFITTSGGLYRYAMHDILEVTGFKGRTPMVRFVQKEKGILNFTGEKLTEAQVLAAVEDALQPRRTKRSFVAAIGRAPSEDTEASYLFLVEFGTKPDEAEAKKAAKDLDEALSQRNVEYASKRKSGRIAPAVLRVLEAGQYDQFQRRAMREGARDGQFKILRLTDDVTFADRFEKVVGDFEAS